MKKITEVAKRLAGKHIQKSVLRQKNEWPVTSYPIYFQPERPQTDENASKIQKT